MIELKKETDAVTRDGLCHQYTEACNYHRHYSALRFGMLGVYFAVIGAIASVALGIVKTGPMLDSTLVASALGLLFTLAFGLFELLCDKNMTYFGNSIRLLEGQLNYSIMTQRKSNRWLKAGNATKLLYLVISLSWLIALLYNLGEVHMAWFKTIVDLAAVVGLLLTGIGLTYTARQLRISRRIAKGEFLLSLYGVVGEYNDIHAKLTGEGPWAPGRGKPETAEDWARVDRYMGLFETIEILVQDKILDLGTVDRQYGHRVAALVQNEHVRKRNLVDRSYRWRDFIKLWDCLKKEEYFQKALDASPTDSRRDSTGMQVQSLKS